MKYLYTSAIAALCLMTSNPATAQNFDYASYLPPVHVSNLHGLTPLFENVAKQTDGATNITLHAGGSLSGAKDTLTSIESGLIDGGFVVSVYVPDDIPLNNALSDLVMRITDPVAGMGAINETMLIDCPDCVQEYNNRNVTPLGAYSTTPYKLMCRDQITTLEQIKGKKIRSAGDVWGRWIIEMGGIPVTVPNSEAYEAYEAYEALQRGQLDCIYGSVGWLKTLSLWDVSKNVLDQPMGSYAGGSFISFNSDSWDSMGENGRAAVLQHIPAAMAQVAFAYRAEDQRALDEGVEKGVVIYPTNADFVDLLAKYSESELAWVTESAQKRGAQGVEAALAAMIKNIDKWNKIAAEVGNDQEAFAIALEREIYSKITR